MAALGDVAEDVAEPPACCRLVPVEPGGGAWDAAVRLLADVTDDGDEDDDVDVADSVRALGFSCDPAAPAASDPPAAVPLPAPPSTRGASGRRALSSSCSRFHSSSRSRSRFFSLFLLVFVFFVGERRKKTEKGK